MKTLLRYVAPLLCSVLIAACASAPSAKLIAPVAAPDRILFVGNSFTYYNDSLHQHLRKIMRGKGIEPGVMNIMTISGSRLSQHEPALPALLASSSFDTVVLQGHSLEPIEEHRTFARSVRKLNRVIERSGAQTVLFMTWAYADKPEMTKPLAQAYTTIGNELEARVVPVGLAVALSTKRHPEIQLLHDDRRHPTLAGTYLAGCVFYAALYNVSPIGSSYTAGLDPKQAAALQAIAWTTTQQYYGRPD